MVPELIGKIEKLGFKVRIESGAGVGAGYPDEMYTEAGAEIVDAEAAWQQEVVIRLRPPTVEQIGKLREGATFVSLLYPAENQPLLDAFADKKVNAIALDKVPRISRAQKMDVLSSMSNVSGYRAVLEAANAYQGFMGAQVTAAGTQRPSKMLVIGAGVAGLAALGAGRALGAEVRVFDVRAACKEQVESLGGKFLEVEMEESGEGAGGYAKTMSKEFIEAEMALFLEQAKEVDFIITTALIPGKKAPILVKKEHVEAMKPGSVVVDLAAERGGNCEVTVADKAIVHNGVHVLGYTDLASRMARTSSFFFAGNIRHLLDDMVGEEGFQIDLEDEVVRGAIQVHAEMGIMEPPPPPEPSPPKKEEAAPVVVEVEKKDSGPSPVTSAISLVAVFASIFVVGLFAPADFVQRFTVFVLACFVGWQVVWNVTAALHTPLMSVTNAISGIIIVGGMIQAGVGLHTESGELNLAAILGAIAIFVASINIFGGFWVTHRMLKMFRRGES